MTTIACAVVGSGNQVKLAAARAVLARGWPDLPVRALAVPSPVRRQPIGEGETLAGAVGRARSALALGQAKGWSVRWGIGFESGVELDGPPGAPAWLVMWAAVVAVDGRTGWAAGPRLPLPPPVAARLADGAELATVLESLGSAADPGAKAGALGFLTQGLADRRQGLELALACALAPWRQPQLYDAAAAVEPPPPAPAGGRRRSRDLSVATFVVSAGRVLLLYHQQLGMWLPPGGHVEPDELPDEAAVREVLEETGIAVQLTSAPALSGVPGPRQLARPEGVQLEDIAPGHQHIDLIYFARPCAGTTLTPQSDAGVERAGWYPPEAFASLGLTDEVRIWAERALAALS